MLNINKDIFLLLVLFLIRAQFEKYQSTKIEYLGTRFNKKINSPPEGIEPSTYGLEVHRAIRCAMEAHTI